MKFLRRFLIRLWNFATRQSEDQRLQEEIAEHLAFQIEENLRAGMSSVEARRQAARLTLSSRDPDFFEDPSLGYEKNRRAKYVTVRVIRRANSRRPPSCAG